MMTLTSEAEKIDEKEKTIAALIVKDEKDQLVPEMMADLVFIDDNTLLNAVAEKLKPAGFLLLHSTAPYEAEIEGLTAVSQKISQDRTMTLFRKVNLAQNSS